ncbi:MAG: molybdopterin-guanine dinucleotide biosynthesis protein B [Burkholderiales bacterium]
MKIFGFAGYSGSGKTTLIEKLIPLFVQEGLRVSLIKHAHHDFDLDQPGKDSHRHRAAGAGEVLISSNRRWAIMHELAGEAELPLAALLGRLSPCDIVFVEGFKHDPILKIEVHRKAAMKPLLFPEDPHIVGIACDARIETALPLIDLDRPDLIAAFIKNHLGMNP